MALLIFGRSIQRQVTSHHQKSILSFERRRARTKQRRREKSRTSTVSAACSLTPSSSYLPRSPSLSSVPHLRALAQSLSISRVGVEAKSADRVQLPAIPLHVPACARRTICLPLLGLR